MDQPTCDGFNTYVVSKHARRPGSPCRCPASAATSCSPATATTGGSWPPSPGSGSLPRIAVAGRDIGGSAPQTALRASSRRSRSPARRSRGLYYAARGLFAPSADSRARSTGGASRRPAWAGTTRVRSFLPAAAPARSTDGRRSVFHSVAALEIRRYMHDQLLRDSDVFGLAHSLEIRVPLIDHRLVEAVFNTAPAASHRRRFGQPRTKALLLDALPAPLPATLHPPAEDGLHVPVRRLAARPVGRAESGAGGRPSTRGPAPLLLPSAPARVGAGSGTGQTALVEAVGA